MKRQSQNAQILELLSGGQWVGHHRLYEIGCVAHSRIAELRTRGYVIEQRRVKVDGRPVWEYRLIGEVEEARSPRVCSPMLRGCGETATAGTLVSPPASSTSSPGHFHADSQLSIFEAA